MNRAAGDGIYVLVPTKMKTKPDDVIELCFGEIDCRAHICKQVIPNGRVTITEVFILTNLYAAAITSFNRKVQSQIVQCCVPPHVANRLDSELYGSMDECAHDTQRIRERMKSNLLGLGYPFVDYHDAVVKSNGAFKPEFFDEVCLV